eukprot:12890-Eustigmatos_ZCMA.PRE.1
MKETLLRSEGDIQLGAGCAELTAIRCIVAHDRSRVWKGRVGGVGRGCSSMSKRKGRFRIAWKQHHHEVIPDASSKATQRQ